MKKPQLVHPWGGVLFLAMLSACGGGGRSSSPGTLQIETTLYDVREGTIVNIRVARSSGSDGDVSVNYTTMDGTAVGGADYTISNGTLIWPSGVSGNRTISIPIPDDGTAEFTKSFTLKLRNVSGGATLGANSTATVTVIDDDTAAVSAFGAITALGSATVNGIRYDTNATTVAVNGQAAQVADLKPGQVVAINGNVNLSKLTGTADEINSAATVVGPVGVIEAPQLHLIIMGQSVYTNAETVFDPSINPITYAGLSIDDTVEVSGFRNAAGEVIATRIAPDTTSTSQQVIGTVSGADVINMRLSIDGLTVDYSSATQNDLPGGAPVNGQLVIVRGSLTGDILVANEIAGLATATTTPGERALVSGLVTRFATVSDFDLNNFAVTTDANTEYHDGAAGDVKIDTEIIVDGEITAGGDTVSAHDIYFNGLPSDRTISTFDFDNFTNVVADGFLNLTVTQGPRFSVEEIVNSYFVNDAQMTQTGDTLFVQDAGSKTLIRDVFVIMPLLNRIDVEPDSLGNITIRDLNQAQMAVNVDGVSLLRGDALTIGNLTATVAGVSIMDFGNISPIGNANIAISGVSQATLNMDVGTTITGSVVTGKGTGHSILYYYGTNVTANVTTDSISEVIWLGDTKN